MPDTGFLDELVKLASLGASGISIFAIFWIGWLLAHPPANVNKGWNRLAEIFIGACILLALISGASGIANAWFNRETINQLQSEKTSIAADLTKAEAERVAADRKLAESVASTKAIAESLTIVLNAKEAEALRTSAQPEIQTSIQILKDNVKQLQNLTGPS